MKKLLFLILLFVSITQSGFGQTELWKKTAEDRLLMFEKMDRSSFPSKFDLYQLDLQQLQSRLQQAPLDITSTHSDVVIPFPNSSGKIEKFTVFYAPVMEDGLASRYPEIKSYVGKGIDDPTATIRFSITTFGFHLMATSGNSGTYYIDTYTKDLNNYIVYNKKDNERARSFGCFTSEDEPTLQVDNTLGGRINDGTFRQYRLAIACTVEYSAFHLTAAGTPATAPLAVKKGVVLSAMAVSLTRLNGIYERDMSLRMNLVANNDLIVFIDSDNFTNSPTMINEIQPIVDAAIGFSNYDMGHGYCTTDSGIAQLSSVCGSGKARGITGQINPVGDQFDVDYVAHEMGHQFGATHTQNNDCQRSGTTSAEPGSGSTIMAYAGICAPNVQNNSDAHFHAVSLEQMITFVTNAGNCGANISNGNNAPVVNAGPNYTIPRGTAFVLRGSATDANGDALTYCWEQTNVEVSTQPPTQTNTTGPNFRSNPPTSSPNRFMPSFANVLLGNLAPAWEVVPNVGRSMSFALTVRDNRAPNGGQTRRANMNVTVSSNGPFAVTSPSADNASWPLGSTQTITWSVANTNAFPINTANVRISYSTDGGATFTTLLASTPNDGSETITVPNILSTTGRIMIEAINNIYYCVSKNIAFGYSIVNSCNTYTGSALPILTAAGFPANQIGTVNVPVTGTIGSVSVFNNVTHAYMSDVTTDISSPQNPTTFIKAFNRFCTNLNGSLNIKFSDGAGALNCNAGGTVLQTVAPGESFAPFVGQNPQGVWRLRVYDPFTGDNGNLNSWGIEICTQTVTLVTESFGLEGFGIYPNPNNGNFNIKFNSSSTNEIGVFVHDIRGREILNKQFQNTGLFEENIQLSSVQAGVYLVTVQDGDKKEVKKIVIE
jgi:subtilisin-like proprotein convertase family protein